MTALLIGLKVNFNRLYPSSHINVLIIVINLVVLTRNVAVRSSTDQTFRPHL